MILKNKYVSIAANVLSQHLQSGQIDYKSELQDDTAMGDNARSFEGGLIDWTWTGVFHQSYGASSPDAIIFPLVGTTVAVEFRPDAGAVAVGNPKYTGTGIVESCEPIKGSVGDHAVNQVVIRPAGTVLTRATA